MGKEAWRAENEEASGQSFNGLAPDASAREEEPELPAIERPYNVFDKYKKTGIVQRIAKNPVFDGLTLAVIASNALWIGFDTNSNHAENIADANPEFMIGENFFAWYFTFE